MPVSTSTKGQTITGSGTSTVYCYCSSPSEPNAVVRDGQSTVPASSTVSGSVYYESPPEVIKERKRLFGIKKMAMRNN